jgi:hypothetical protein
MSEDGRGYDSTGEPDSKRISLEGEEGKKRGRKPGSFKRRSSGDGASPSWNDMFFALVRIRGKAY